MKEPLGSVACCRIRAQITRWVDKYPPPGIVECSFKDIDGQVHSFIGKFYDFTEAELWSDSSYPLLGFVACEVISRWNKDGQKFADIETDSISSGRGLASESGKSRFIVDDGQLEIR